MNAASIVGIAVLVIFSLYLVLDFYVTEVRWPREVDLASGEDDDVADSNE